MGYNTTTDLVVTNEFSDSSDTTVDFIGPTTAYATVSSTALSTIFQNTDFVSILKQNISTDNPFFKIILGNSSNTAVNTTDLVGTNEFSDFLDTTVDVIGPTTANATVSSTALSTIFPNNYFVSILNQTISTNNPIFKIFLGDPSDTTDLVGTNEFSDSSNTTLDLFGPTLAYPTVSSTALSTIVLNDNFVSDLRQQISRTNPLFRIILNATNGTGNSTAAQNLTNEALTFQNNLPSMSSEQVLNASRSIALHYYDLCRTVRSVATFNITVAAFVAMFVDRGMLEYFGRLPNRREIGVEAAARANAAEARAARATTAAEARAARAEARAEARAARAEAEQKHEQTQQKHEQTQQKHEQTQQKH